MKKRYRFSKSKKTLPKYMKKKVEKAAKRLEQWNEAGVTSNEQRAAEFLLEKFYKDNKKQVKDTRSPNQRIRVSKSERQEYDAILNYILDVMDTPSERNVNNKRIRDLWDINDDNRAKSNYDMFSNRYNVHDEQDFIDAVDDVNRIKNDRVLSDLLSSDQWLILRGYGLQLNKPMSEIEKMALDIYNKTGKTYDTLFNEIITFLEG